MTSKATPEAVTARRKSKKEAASSSVTEEKVWLSSLKPITQEVFLVLPPAAWAGMTTEFYITFWQLSLGDIFVPEAQYRLKIQEQKAAMAAAMDQDRRNNSVEDQLERVADRHPLKQDRLDHATGRLKAEMEAQATNKMFVMERLEREKEHWFKGLSEEGSISEVVCHCIIPRAKTSSVDALFCFKYLDILHAIDTPNFLCLTLYNKLFDELDNIVACLTKSEAGNFGVLLQEILQQLDKWWRIKAMYKCEGQSRRSFDLPGFKGREPPEYIEDMTKSDYLDHKSFQKLCMDGTTKSLSLKSGQHVRARNSLIILNKVAACFPVLLCHGEKLSKRASDIATNSAKGDLKWMADDYLVKANESQSWIGCNEFFRGKPGGFKASSASASGAVQIDRNCSLPKVTPRSDPKSDVTTKIGHRREGNESLRLRILRPKRSTTMNSNTSKITNTTHTISITAENQQVER
ncbi:THO complex subunit 2 [Podila clonocystis]|nr:THO complex subunit 2 [Podila clonocystis]